MLGGERQITIDCDVLQADGGTRTASITGAWIALRDCLDWMRSRSIIKDMPLKDHVAAVSCGVCNGETVLDLDYTEDSTAETDAISSSPARAASSRCRRRRENAVFSQAELDAMLTLARGGVAELVALQKATIG